METIEGKIVVVTGASSGIGESTARLLAQKGAKVALVARSEAKLRTLEQELPGSLAIVADMGDREAVAGMIRQVKEHYGRIDILVNNAGVGIYGAVEHVKIDDFETVFNVNVVGPLVAMQQVIPLMREQGHGTIVNISSMVSKNYFPMLGAYAATKYALNALSLTARQELAKDNITVNLMLPGMTATDFGKNAIKSERAAQSMQSRRREGMPEPDSPELIAERIALAIETGEPEIFAH